LRVIARPDHVVDALFDDVYPTGLMPPQVQSPRPSDDRVVSRRGPMEELTRRRRAVDSGERLAHTGFSIRLEDLRVARPAGSRVDIAGLECACARDGEQDAPAHVSVRLRALREPCRGSAAPPGTLA